MLKDKKNVFAFSVHTGYAHLVCTLILHTHTSHLTTHSVKVKGEKLFFCSHPVFTLIHHIHTSHHTTHSVKHPMCT